MKKLFLLISACVFTFISGGGNLYAQTDVTSTYLINPGFEDCEALVPATVHDVAADVDRPVVNLAPSYSIASGTDYSAQGWTLVEKKTGANGGVIAYQEGLYIQHKSYNKVGDAAPASDNAGQMGKALCFQGNNSVVYRQTAKTALKAGSYTLTVHVWACNGATTNPQPTIGLDNCYTGFVTADDTPYFCEKKGNYTSNGWYTDVIKFELTKDTEGYFQITYGNTYFTAVDNLKLEYEGGVITTALKNVVTKATALNALLNNSELTTAISNANAFIASPTTQEEVTTQVNTLYTAMSTALAASTKAVNLTDIYLENGSFETGKIEPWAWGTKTGTVGEPTNTDSKPYIDGNNIVEFSTSGTNALSQTISHLPVGYYAIDAKLNQKAFLSVGESKALLQGGLDALYLRCHPAIQQVTTAGDLTIGANASVSFRVDNFRLFYGPDEATLLAVLLPDVKADGQNILDMTAFASITGSERTALTTAIAGTDIDAINIAIQNFVSAKDAYEAFAKAKTNAAKYTQEAYPYASATIYQQIQTLVGTDATSAEDATAKATELETACFNYYVSNFYCEGIESKTDYTSSIVGANATGTAVATAWHKLNMDIRTDKTWTNPKTKADDKIVYGVTTDYYKVSKDATSYMQQTISGLPAGKYVLSAVVLAAAPSSAPQPLIKVNGTQVGALTGVGLYGGGVYGGGWVDNAIEFDKADAADMTLRLEFTGSANYQQWFFDNLRLYKIDKTPTAIQSVKATSSALDGTYYNLSGQRVERPTKGLYIINGRKVIVK